MDCVALRTTHTHATPLSWGEGDGLHCACEFCTHTQPLTPTPLPGVLGRGASGTDSQRTAVIGVVDEADIVNCLEVTLTFFPFTVIEAVTV
jgi:hypothetical protein